MPKFTDEQNNFITHNVIEDNKLIACAGSGKTFTVIFRINFMITNKMLESDQILMLTFSRFTRDDFLNKIKKHSIDSIKEKNIKTIDSFAKSIIDDNNEVDVSLLSYKFMKYLESVSVENIKKCKKLQQIKCIFVDEAQDLNEIQYKILILLKEKCGIVINLVGDPNQNIYQFRNSSDKFLTEFNAKTFYLSKNFRSYDSIIEFSKHLRPVENIDITGHLGKIDCIPNFIFHENDSELEKHLISLLENAIDAGVKYEDIAILAPTRGRMKGYGRSHGLCLVSNLLYKNKIEFKQFYEESTDEQQSNIKYCPKKDHINVLTFMGSKGLEWRYVILVDADICLINKRCFTEEKHKADQYLLYVACSRAIENVFIFSKYKFYEGCLTFQLNPWFSLIPKEMYTMDKRFESYFRYPRIKYHDMGNNEKRVTKIIDKIDEKHLDELSEICNYGKYSEDNRVITKIYDKDFSVTINSNIFLGLYIENLFCVYYRMKKGIEKKKYPDIENIINKSIITDVPISVSEWFYINREHLNWEYFDTEKYNLDKLIVDTVEKRFNRDQKLQDHTIVNDGYFKSFILALSETIKDNYDKYLQTENTKKIRTYLFNIMVISYSLNTQHYFHALSRGKKFKDILKFCSDMFDKVQEFAFTTDLIFEKNNVQISKIGLVGEIDLITDDNTIFEIKCTSDISLKHILQVVQYNIIHHSLDSDCVVCANFINFLKGEMIKFRIQLTKENIQRINEIFSL